MTGMLPVNTAEAANYNEQMIAASHACLAALKKRYTVPTPDWLS